MILDLGPGAPAVGWLCLWEWVGERDADVTHLLDRVGGLMPESTWRGARRRLFDRGYLIAQVLPSGREFVTITSQPDACNRVAPDPQKEFGFLGGDAQDSEGTLPAPQAPHTVPLQRTGFMQAVVGSEDPGARNPRGICAESAPPQYQEKRARPRQNQEQEPKKLLGLGSCSWVKGGAESAQNTRGGEPAQIGADLEAVAGQITHGPDPAGDWAARQKVVAWILANVPDACPIQAAIAAEAVFDCPGADADLRGALHRVRTLIEAGEIRKTFAAAFFGTFKCMVGRRGFVWPKRAKPR